MDRLRGKCIWGVVPSVVEEDSEASFYPGFDDDARTWGLQTSAGIGVGVAMGWIKGASQSAHLAGTYGRGSVYHGTFAEFRVPSNYVQAAMQSASWGWRVGIFTASFSALNLYLERKGGSFLFIGSGPSDKHQAGGPRHDPLTPRERAEFIAAGGRPFQPSGSGTTKAIGEPPHASRASEYSQMCSMDLLMRVLPSASAGGFVGGSFGVLRQGGLRGATLGGLLGLGLGGGLKSLEVFVEQLVEKIKAEESAKAGSMAARPQSSKA